MSNSDILTDSTGKGMNDSFDIWNISEPNYEDFVLDDSGNVKMTPFKNSSGFVMEKQSKENLELFSCNKIRNLSLDFNKNEKQIYIISPTPKRCSLNTEYSADINRQLSRSFSNVTQRKPNVTSTLCNIRSKVIMDQLNAALSSRKSKDVVKLTLSQSTNTSPAKKVKIIHLNQRSPSHKKKTSLLKNNRLNFVQWMKQFKWNIVGFMILLYILLFALLYLALAMPNPICLDEEISKCFHEGESLTFFQILCPQMLIMLIIFISVKLRS